MRAWLQRIAGRRKPTPVVVPPELTGEARTYVLPPPAYYEAIRQGKARNRLHQGLLWRCWLCAHWCDRARWCCSCGGSAP